MVVPPLPPPPHRNRGGMFPRLGNASRSLFLLLFGFFSPFFHLPPLSFFLFPFQLSLFLVSESTHMVGQQVPWYYCFRLFPRNGFLFQSLASFPFGPPWFPPRRPRFISKECPPLTLFNPPPLFNADGTLSLLQVSPSPLTDFHARRFHRNSFFRSVCFSSFFFSCLSDLATPLRCWQPSPPPPRYTVPPDKHSRGQ